MKPHCKIAWIQAIHYASVHGGCLIELKQYGYTECNNGVNIYWNRTVGKCFLFADNITTIYDSLETKLPANNITAGLPTLAKDQITKIWSQMKGI